MITNKNGILSLANDFAECKISLWGGQIISYRPKSEEQDIFWLGNYNKFDNQSAIRGGVPICWPRFAAEQLNEHLPRHGFARISNWNLQNVTVENNKMEVELSLSPDKKYDTNVSANLFIKITDKLECCLETTNLGNKDFEFSEALHAYFNVGNRDETLIHGLSGIHYKSAPDGKNYILNGNLNITDEFDAAFMNHSGNIEIEDPILKRIIRLEKTGSNTTIVWNPNKDLNEMSEGQYKRFICVEPANQGTSYVTLKPRENHKITMIINVIKSN